MPSGNPPRIEDERAVIDWLIQNDSELANLRSSPALVDQVRQEVGDDLRARRDGFALREHLKELTGFRAQVARPEADRRRQNRGPLPGEDRRTYLKYLVLDMITAAKIRILEHFLMHKYGFACDYRE